MRKGKNSIWDEELYEQEYWISYSDLMASLLMVFALLLLATLNNYQKGVTSVRDLIDTRKQISSDLLDKMGNDKVLKVSIDPVTGSVRFTDQVLFEEGSSRLSEKGKVQLSLFGEKYMGVLLGNDTYRAHLADIVIEGHTNMNGSYLYNLDLSQRRALEVMKFWIEHPRGFDGELLKRYASANGKSFSNMVTRSDGSPDHERSRRIEVRFRLDDEKTLEQIQRRILLEDKK